MSASKVPLIPSKNCKTDHRIASTAIGARAEMLMLPDLKLSCAGTLKAKSASMREARRCMRWTPPIIVRFLSAS